MSDHSLPSSIRALLPAAPPTLICPATSDDTETITVATLLADQRVVDDDAAQACVAGMLLARDRFHESHAVSQNLATPEGSYWHGILHRREPDAGNAKYWMRLVGTHPVHRPLAAAVRELGAGWLLDRGIWNAARFIDACGTGDSDDERSLEVVQAKEIELLLAWCVTKALGNREAES